MCCGVTPRDSGYWIFANYRYGSSRWALEAGDFALPGAVLIGAKHGHLQNVPAELMIPMTARDRTLATNMLAGGEVRRAAQTSTLILTLTLTLTLKLTLKLTLTWKLTLTLTLKLKTMAHAQGSVHVDHHDDIRWMLHTSQKVSRVFLPVSTRVSCLMSRRIASRATQAEIEALYADVVDGDPLTDFVLDAIAAVRKLTLFMFAFSFFVYLACVFLHR